MSRRHKSLSPAQMRVLENMRKMTRGEACGIRLMGPRTAKFWGGTDKTLQALEDAGYVVRVGTCTFLDHYMLRPRTLGEMRQSIVELLKSSDDGMELSAFIEQLRLLGVRK